VQAQNTQAAKEPKKICNEDIFHSNRLGLMALGFQSRIASLK